MIGTQTTPMRWMAGRWTLPGGRRKEFHTGDRRDYSPVAGSVVTGIGAGTAGHCLVVSWASGLPADAEQQQGVEALLEKGGRQDWSSWD